MNPLEATLENYREGMALIAEMLRPCKEDLNSTGIEEVLVLLDTLLGMNGKQHLLALRQHESLVMGLLAYRANAIEALLPDTCPHCGLAGRQHDDRCRFGLALTMIPEGMPSIEESATFKLGVLAGQIRRWLAQIEAIPEGRPRVEVQLGAVIGSMREVASNI